MKTATCRKECSSFYLLFICSSVRSTLRVKKLSYVNISAATILDKTNCDKHISYMIFSLVSIVLENG